MRLKKLKNKIFILVFLACTLAIFSITLVHALFPIKLYNDVKFVCDKTQVPPYLVLAIIKTESSFSSEKVSTKGAKGLMQIMPETADYVSELYFSGRDIDLANDKDNILIGVTYLIYLFDKFEDKKTVLAAYNAGEGRVLEWLDNKDFSLDGKTLCNIPYKETHEYVEKVIHREKIYNLLY